MKGVVLPDRAITVLAAMCGGSAAAAGVLVLFSALGNGYPANVFAAIGISLAYFALTALVIFIFCGVGLYVIPRPDIAGSRIVRLGRELLIGPIWAAILLTYVFLALFLISIANVVIQIGFIGALFTDNLEKHSYLVSFSLIAGILFGITTSLRGVWKHRLDWRASVGHGLNRAAISSFLIYAGLVLMNYSVDWVVNNANTLRDNPWAVILFVAEMMLVMFGTVAVIFTHVRAWPTDYKRNERCLHGSPTTVIWLKNFRLRWRRWHYRRRTKHDWPLFP